MPVPEDTASIGLGSSLKNSWYSPHSPSPTRPSFLPRRRKHNITPTHSVCLYVTSPSTAVLMVLYPLSCDVVKSGYFALGLTVQSCSGNSCSGRWLLIHRGDCSISTCYILSSTFSVLSASFIRHPHLKRYPRFRIIMNNFMGRGVL